MSGSLAIVVGVVGAVVFVLLVAVVVVVVLRSRRKEPTREERWLATGQAASLRPELGGTGLRGPRRLLGMRGPIEVIASWRDGGEGGLMTLAHARITPPLRMGLHMYPEGGAMAATLERLLGTQDVPVGVPEVDNPFVIRGFDPAQLAAFFQGGGAGAITKATSAMRPGWQLQVTDRLVEIRLPGLCTDPALLGSALEAAARCAGELKGARRRLALAPWEEHLAWAWERTAVQRGLAFARAELMLVGKVKDVPLEIWVDQDNGTWSTVFEAKLTRPLRASIRIFKDGRLYGIGKVQGLQDISVGDPQFDDTFVVQGESPATVRGLLDAETRYYLLQLAAPEGHDAVLEQDRLIVQVSNVLNEEARLLALIDRVAQLVSDLVSTGGR